jgi:RNA polymerase sigma-70 factor (ECF subfamily)
MRAHAVHRPEADESDAAPASARDLETVYKQYAPQVAAWAARLGGPGADVEDILHEVFLVVQRRLPEFRGDAKLSTWLFQITVRVVHGYRRKQRIRRWIGLDDALEEIAEDTPSPIQAIEARQSAARLYRALDAMNERYRTVLILFELEELSGEEIACIMNAKLGTVWVWLHRARQQFVRVLNTTDDAARGES